jgi:hypothetical protein
MTLTLTDTLQILATLATDAQRSGLVPGGTPALVLASLVAGLQLTLASGVLDPHTPIEVNDIGQAFADAMARMRAARAGGAA